MAFKEIAFQLNNLGFNICPTVMEDDLYKYVTP